jgi:hypothetical protein
LPEENWERGSVPLKLQLGDVVFGNVVLSLFRRSARIDEHPLEVGEVPESPPQLDGADGYVVWSQPIAQRLPVLSAGRAMVVYAPRQYRRFSIDLSGDFERYFAGLSGNTRSGLRRKLRKFRGASGSAIDWKEYHTPREIAEFFPLARRVSTKSYQERLLSAGLPTDEAFVGAARVLASEDGVRAYLLFLHGEPISYLYCPIREGVVIYDHLGYDPAYASLSPGTVLQMLALESLFAEQRFTTFDFTEGEGQHKEIFSTGYCLCGDVYVVSRRFIPVSSVMLHLAVDRTSAGIGAILEQLKLKSRLRRLIRRS